MINHIDKVIYTGKTHTTGGRQGKSRSSDDRLVIDLSAPGSNGPGTNPEQLLGAGWSVCFFSAIGKAAQGAKVALPADAAVDAEVDLGLTGRRPPSLRRVSTSACRAWTVTWPSPW